MSPVTRSGRSVKASSTKDKLDDGVNNLSPELPTEAVNQLPSSTSVTLESLLTRALGGAKELERENNTLRKKVKLLESRLDRVEQDVPPQSQPRRATRATATTTQLKSEVTQLKKQVKRLEKSAEKYRKRVHQLSMRELKTEADELLETAEFEVGDSAHKMRKLLRRFHDLMLENSLDENEECLICFEALLPKKTRSLPCQHTFCDGCISKLKPEPDEDESIRCPQCRMLCLRDEAELIEFTASEQWDALLDVARQWARMDVRREDDTTEEEDAEEFLDDGVEESSTTGSEPPPAHANPLESSPEPSVEHPQTVVPSTPSRLRKRRAIATPTASTPEPEDDNHTAAPGPSTTTQLDDGEENVPKNAPPPPSPTTPTASTSTQSVPSYSQSPTKDKRKMLEQLAEARSKKPRY